MAAVKRMKVTMMSMMAVNSEEEKDSSDVIIQIQSLNDNSPKLVFHCHFTIKYRISILRVLESTQQRLTYLFDTLVNALDETDRLQQHGIYVRGFVLVLR